MNPQQTMYDPQWTTVVYIPGGSRDALGIETLSEAILADLLPGINNQTRRARYYSFWAWALHGFIHDPAAIHTQKGFYKWSRGREDTLILAQIAHGCSGAAAGTTQGLQVWQGGELAIYPVDWKSLTSVDGGSYELYYRGALSEMNIIAVNEASPHDDLLKPVGIRLAETYASAVQSTQYVNTYLDATAITKPVIEDFAQSGCLCQAARIEDERQALIAAFFRFDTPDSYAIKRLASLAFFLDLIEQSNGLPLDDQHMRAAIYFWAFDAHHAYVPVGNLVEPAQRWRIFQLRQYYVFAIESLWSLFLYRIHDQPATARDYIANLLTELDLKQLATELNLDLPSTNPHTLTLEAFYASIRQAVPEFWLPGNEASQRASLNEHDLSAPLWSSYTILDVQKRAGNALVILALIYWRSEPWRTLPGWYYATDRYAEGRLPIAAYIRHVDTAFAEGWTLAAWVAMLHEHYLWMQHRRVTLEKLLSRNQDTAMFAINDDVTSFPEHYVGVVREPVMYAHKVDVPKMNGPRFLSALQIMQDLQLIESVAGGGYQLLQDGQTLLSRFRTYTVPVSSAVRTDETPTQLDQPAG